MSQEDCLAIVLIEDNPTTREAVRLLFNGTTGFCCRAAFSSMEDALAHPWPKAPDAALVDLGLPGMPGTDGILLLHEKYPDCVLLAFTVYEDDERLFAALRSGASGYLLKKTPPAQLLESVREAVRGGAPISPQVARKVIHFFRDTKKPASELQALTPHELKVLKLLVNGHTYKTAAIELNVTANAVSFHVKRIYEKLHVHSKAQAVAHALRTGIVG
ncbi:MAG: response regulator transcription factor [Acidobacteria bacterium]|nr:response regulator transcription factor [Acidobacteriota bacterium]